MTRLAVLLALLSGTLVALLASTVVPARAGAARGRVGTIAFLRQLATGTGLFTIRPDGSDLRRLTPSGVDVASYEWAPDGRRIAYWYRISVISTGGGEPRRLPSGEVQDLDWSPRGDEIAYWCGCGLQRIIRTDGSKPRPFFTKPPKHGIGSPTWSPDGTHVGFTGHVRHGHRFNPPDWYDAIYVSDADGRNLHLVTSRADSEYGFAWSPDGRTILYGRAHGQGIYVIGADGRTNHRVTRDAPPGNEWPALAWSPDGDSIVYDTDATGHGDIYVIGVDGRGEVRLTNTPSTDLAPTWVAA
jgi:Tol biopolymer transport system component